MRCAERAIEPGFEGSRRDVLSTVCSDRATCVHNLPAAPVVVATAGRAPVPAETGEGQTWGLAPQCS